ncbi:MAG: hypothetical protein GC159_04760 [Phycisphaera sp.]|nr:hypothetical protein [Phycisphaera sp.]
MHHHTPNRVPHIIALYWVIKIAATTLGETGADMFSMTLDMGYGLTIVLFLSIFLVLLAIKLAIKRYDTFVYWLTFTASAIAGTGISDFIDRTLGLGYVGGSAVLLVLLLVVLKLWHMKDKSLSVENIHTAPSEIYYWVAFLIANTLGTAAGDYVADSLELGFMLSAGIISGLLLVTLLLHYYTKVSTVLLFWIAFVLTRPFGATFGDLLTKTTDQGGLNLGTMGASIFFAVILVIALIYETRMETVAEVIEEIEEEKAEAEE